VLIEVSFHLAAGETLGCSAAPAAARPYHHPPDRPALRPDVRHGAAGWPRRPRRHAAELRAPRRVVTHDVQLFGASIRENLTFFARSPRAAGGGSAGTSLGPLGSSANRRPRHDAVIPARASSASGEAQLLAFARVFLRDPGLVLLD